MHLQPTGGSRFAFGDGSPSLWWVGDRSQVYLIWLGIARQKPIVLEVCAAPDLAIWRACRERGLECVSVTKEERNLFFDP